ncbi:MAG TPA: DNA starvation/stationary phase protection protein [Acidimicrobiia bacterium]
MESNFAPAGMSISDAESSNQILQERLSDLIDLSLTLKHVHWNVSGPGFIAVHKLMDAQTALIRDLVDEVAERITTMGGVAAGLAGEVTRMRSQNEDYALGRAPVVAHLGALDQTYSRVCSKHREAAAEIGETDLVSQDLLVGQTGKLDLNHWFIRAHLEDTSGHLITGDAATEMDAAVEAAQAQDGTEILEDEFANEPVPIT